MTALARNHSLEETILHWKHIAPIIHEPQNHIEYEQLANMLDQLLDRGLKCNFYKPLTSDDNLIHIVLPPE